MIEASTRVRTGAVSRRAAINAADLLPELSGPLRDFFAEALCVERTVDLAASELVAAAALSPGLLVSAHATPAPELTAAPMPRATASPPTRPILAEAFMSTP